MHSHSIDQWTHDHVFLGEAHARNERRTWGVVALTVAMMVGEITAGTLFGSMARAALCLLAAATTASASRAGRSMLPGCCTT